jgi:hypothetical protein
MLKGYLAANLNDSDLVLEAVAFDVKTQKLAANKAITIK